MFFFFQAEDGIRYRDVTGVQTCALPISGEEVAARDWLGHAPATWRDGDEVVSWFDLCLPPTQIGRASCRERGEISGGARRLAENKVDLVSRMRSVSYAYYS